MYDDRVFRAVLIRYDGLIRVGHSPAEHDVVGIRADTGNIRRQDIINGLIGNVDAGNPESCFMRFVAPEVPAVTVLVKERGREGVVVLVVTTVAGVAIPQVRLSQSSGSDLLDQAALELLEIAVQTATLPESLRGQQFGLTLPIHYRLDD